MIVQHTLPKFGLFAWRNGIVKPFYHILQQIIYENQNLFSPFSISHGQGLVFFPINECPGLK